VGRATKILMRQEYFLMVTDTMTDAKKNCTLILQNSRGPKNGEKTKEVTMSKTENNLLEAFAGESQANRRYLAFAKKADDEGYKQVAKLFRAAAEAETVHAHNHLKELGGIKATKENLEVAVGGETHEFQNMYPRMIEEADAEGKKSAVRSFHLANEVEKIHAALYKKALENLGSNPEVDYHVCQVCGNTVEGEPPDKCPICGAPKKMFRKVD
jgi:rubrerythrin